MPYALLACLSVPAIVVAAIAATAATIAVATTWSATTIAAAATRTASTIAAAVATATAITIATTAESRAAARTIVRTLGHSFRQRDQRLAAESQLATILNLEQLHLDAIADGKHVFD